MKVIFAKEDTLRNLSPRCTNSLCTSITKKQTNQIGAQDLNGLFSKEDMVPGCLSEEEHALIGKVRKIYNDKMFVQCTACAYCMPCPMGVNIPEIFHWMNDGALAESYKRSREHYQQEAIPGGFDASRCVECGACESHCPQSISIREKLKEAHAVLA